jgi:hypothetical protein
MKASRCNRDWPAVAVLAAGGAPAQTLKADIPFTFQVGGVVRSPGTYRVVIWHNAGERHLIFRKRGHERVSAGSLCAG